ncbi:MAG: hypothetical protein JWO84_604 [Parcubacteria group bacterium]|nr:hypothetical protein [Parcubacteria group bacterium]
MSRWNYEQSRPPESFIRPEERTQDTARLYIALEAELPDPRYPPHDEERFQEAYPRTGNGGYGSPGEF